jgi:hypothetical protein
MPKELHGQLIFVVLLLGGNGIFHRFTNTSFSIAWRWELCPTRHLLTRAKIAGARSGKIHPQ